MVVRLCCGLLGAVLLCNCVNAQNVESKTGQDASAIRVAIESYVAAFNARDAEKLVAHWSINGVFTSRSSGEQITGHAAMRKEFSATFEIENPPTLSVVTTSIEFISPNVAVEQGTATVSRESEDDSNSEYSVVYVKHDGAWLIDRVTEDEIELAPSSALNELEWLVGEWTNENDGINIDMNCRWTSNQTYLSRTYKVTVDGEIESSGLQLIGWDAAHNEIRSWLFDSKGGFVAGKWNDRGDHWVVQSVATLSDGGTGSFTSVFRPMEDGDYSWKKINRVIDGKLLPNIDSQVVRRK